MVRGACRQYGWSDFPFMPVCPVWVTRVVCGLSVGPVVQTGAVLISDKVQLDA